MAVAFAPAIEPSVSTSVDSQISVIESRFGDGYSQRSSSGIHPVRLKASLVWAGIQNAAADALDADLLAGAAVVARSWTLPSEGSPRLWVVKAHSREYTDQLLSTVKVELEEVFDL